MRTFKTEGIIIKRVNFGEADRILTVFTKYHGKLQVKAAGIRRIPSRRSAHVELLNHASLSLYKGRNLPVLTEAHEIKNFSIIKNDLQKIGYAYHLCELIDGLCPENQENARVFQMFENVLMDLTESGDDAGGRYVREFEVELLSSLGYWNRSEAVTERFDTRAFIESILERKLKSRRVFAKLY